MKVGIVSCYFHHNYGSMLQAYATQKIIEKLGEDAVTIACYAPITYMTKSKWIYYMGKLSNIDIIKTKIRQVKSKKKMFKHHDIINGIHTRDEKFEQFGHEKFNLSNINKSRDDLKNFTESCDAVIVGSDMLWHPINVEHDYFTLSFVPDNIKKISYATSFGTTKIPKRQYKKYFEFLNRFSAISVREKSGIDVCKKLGLTTDVRVVLDPTLLFTGEEWSEIQKEEPIIKDKYILCYFLGINGEHRKFAKQLQKITGYKIVALKYLDEFVESDLNFGDITPFDIGPVEFINLIKNAQYVCTDSFHGTCFSVLNHKNFFVMNRFSESNSQSTNTRIDSLLALVGLEDRRIAHEFTEEEIRDILRCKISYSFVDERLNLERKKSIQYLKDALGK